MIKIQMVKEYGTRDLKKKYLLRAELVKSIDPLYGNGTDLHEAFMTINHKVNT